MGKKGCGKYKRLADTTLRKQKIIDAAVELADKVGFSNITRDGIANIANVSAGLINFHFDSMVKLRKEIIRYVVEKEVLAIIIQAIGQGELKTEKLPPALKKKIADYLSNQT